MVDNGDDRLEDLIGNDGADTAADLGRLRQHDDVVTAGRDLLRTRRHWYPIILELSLALRLIMMAMEAQSRMLWFGIRVVSSAPRASSPWVVVDHASLPTQVF